MNGMGRRRAIPAATAQTRRRAPGLLLLFCLGLSGAPATAGADLLDAGGLPEADNALVAEQPSLLEEIRMSIALSLAECEDESSCDLVRDGELDTLMTLVDEQVAHLQQQGDIPEDVFAQYKKLKDTYALYRPKLRDINLGISQLTDEELEQLKKETEKLINILVSYELPLPDADDDSELVLASEADGVDGEGPSAPAAPGADTAPSAPSAPSGNTDTGADNNSDSTPAPGP